MEPTSYDLVVIGSGPAGQKGAIAAAKMGKRVAIVDRHGMIGGVCLHAGTIPSKTLRLAVLYLTGFQQKSFYGQAYSPKSHVTVDDLMFRVRTVIEREQAQVTDQLQRNDVTLVNGWARFVDAHTLQVEDGQQVHGDHILIACGTRSARDPEIPYDGEKVMLAEDLGNAGLGEIPRRVIVVGAGVIGLEYASMLSALGVRVTLIESRDTMLDFVDREIIEALRYHMRRRDAIFRLGEHVTGVRIQDNGLVRAELESGKRVTGDALLYTVGRQSNADQLGLDRIGIDTDARGRVAVNDNFRPRGRTSTRSATASASRRWPPPPWSKGGSPARTCSTARLSNPRPSSPTASTPSRRSPWSAAPSRNSPPSACPTRSARPSTRTSPRPRWWATAPACSN